MIGSYLVGCGIILALHWDQLPAAIALILSDAFSQGVTLRRHSYRRDRSPRPIWPHPPSGFAAA
jgi:hypothetical protein